MMDKRDLLNKLFRAWSGQNSDQITALPRSGSAREYYRIRGADKSAIGVYHPDNKENKAFIYLSHHFKQHHLPVPKIYGENLQNHVYLIEDLGDTRLLDKIETDNKTGKPSKDTINLYRKSLDYLLQFQTGASKNIDFSRCYPRSAFDNQSMYWDLSYFKYYFLKPQNLVFNEQDLENDFQDLIRYISKASMDFFMYRDFQARNIMIKNGNPYFIDYQGGRKGPLAYDVISLLFQAQARLSKSVRELLLKHYLFGLGNIDPELVKEFRLFFHALAYIRFMQVLGAYGFRGLIEKKSHFLKSIPKAIDNIKWLLSENQLPIQLATINDLFRQIIELKYPSIDIRSDELTVQLYSFSYKKGIPDDYSGHGGGFVFDCRNLPNPGREEKYKMLNGKDPEVVEFLEGIRAVKDFLANSFKLVENAIQNYNERGFNNLMVCFGCTGGQHRSVYCAEAIYKQLLLKGNCRINLVHTELMK